MVVSPRPAIAMSGDEVYAFLGEQRSATIATIGPSGQPHLVAMWFAVVGDELWIETKAKSQKAVNLLRDDRVTLLVEAGYTYDSLRGVSLECRAIVSNDAGDLWRVGVSLFERYVGPYADELAPAVEAMIYNRVAVRLDVIRTRSWDHRKLGLAPIALGGTTARSLTL